MAPNVKRPQSTGRRVEAGLPRNNLDNLTLAHKEGWREVVKATRRTQPERLTCSQIQALSPSARDTYNQRRIDWHVNMGPLKTPQLAALHEDLWNIVNCAVQDGDKAKGAIALSGYPGVGKSTAVEAFGVGFHRREIDRYGEFTRAGDERWPVCRVGMRGNTTMKDFNRALCDFYAHPGAGRGTTTELAGHALDCVLSCETRLLIIDDLHFLHWQQHGGIEISNHFKYIANEFPLTILSIGIGLDERGLLMDGMSYDDAVLAQTTRRTTMLEMRPFPIDTERERRHWRQLLMTIEQRLLLARPQHGILADKLSDYLYERSTGYIGSLMTLIARGCEKAISTGTERLTEELLQKVKIDSAAERARHELSAAFRTRRLTTRPLR